MATQTMKAIEFTKPGEPSVLQLTERPMPAIENPHDILVKIHASALNPVDTKIREGAFPADPILGYDASGVVVSAGSDSLFPQGAEVMFSGALGRSGTNAQYAVVDSRLVGRKPQGWGWADAAGIPLVGITAWEMLERQFGLKPFEAPKKEETILIVNGAGGVGSMATQLASKVFGIKNVIVTASRQETADWAKRNGATHVISHREPLGPQLEKSGLRPTLAFICYDTPTYVKQLCPLMRNWGKIGSIVETEDSLGFETMDAFSRALSFHWEFMLRNFEDDTDLASQGRLLMQLGDAVDRGLVRPITGRTEQLSVKSLQEMHAFQAGGKAMGKIVFEVGETIN